ncbi:4-alpha-glucanotransferase [Oligoflexaceae bacterium]|nr:4-alpha-glucanotransferase [Oligoflexaceae bacterium]
MARRLPTDQRRSGVLMHISSLPGPYSCGDLGDSAYRFVDLLADNGQTWWQTLPINPIGLGFSPYSSPSSFAFETLFISEEGLFKVGLLQSKHLKKKMNDGSRVQFKKAIQEKKILIDLAFESFSQNKHADYRRKFNRFKKDQMFWLDNFARFTLLSSKWGGDWSKWPEPFRDRSQAAMDELDGKEHLNLEKIKFGQFEFFRQWLELKKYAKSQGVFLMGDIPIFISHESSDVWALPKQFFLKANGQPSSVAGCPPDKFCVDGQMWGNALYDWKVMKKDNFSWWKSRFSHLFKSYDAVRLDHFIGFYNYWKIPAAAKSAKSGKWEKAEGAALFTSLEKEFGRMPLLAEDLGKVTKEVWDLRDRFGFPGMKVLQFGFAKGDGLKVHRPHLLTENSILYSGTHDNDNSLGWYNSILKEKPAKHDIAAVKSTFQDPKNIGHDMIRLGMHSPCRTFIFPVQDLLNLGSKHRMNVPGTAKGNWVFRLDSKMWRELPKNASFLKGLNQMTERNKWSLGHD